MSRERYALQVVAAHLSIGVDVDGHDTLADQVDAILDDGGDDSDAHEVLWFVRGCLSGHLTRRHQRELATAIAQYLRDPEPKPGPEHLPEDVSPRYSGTTGLDYCTTAAA